MNINHTWEWTPVLLKSNTAPQALWYNGQGRPDYNWLKFYAATVWWFLWKTKKIRETFNSNCSSEECVHTSGQEGFGREVALLSLHPEGQLLSNDRWAMAPLCPHSLHSLILMASDALIDRSMSTDKSFRGHWWSRHSCSDDCLSGSSQIRCLSFLFLLFLSLYNTPSFSLSLSSCFGPLSVCPLPTMLRVSC